MPSFARNLEGTLRNALEAASVRRHGHATLEHLLLALIDDPEASNVMEACAVDLKELRETVTRYLDTELEALIVSKEKPQAPPGLNRKRKRTEVSDSPDNPLNESLSSPMQE